MEKDDTQQAILLELRLIRRAVRGIFFFLTFGIVIGLFYASGVHAEISVIIIAGLLAAIFLAGSALGLGKTGG
jgi:hypothetical protein